MILNKYFYVEKMPKCTRCLEILSADSFTENTDGKCDTCQEFVRKGYCKEKASFLEKNPRLEKEWDYEKNTLDPKMLTTYSNKKVWWICSEGKTCIDGENCHRWSARIADRTSKGSNCPYCVCQKLCSQGCASLYYKFPRLRDEWDREKNGDMKLYSGNSHKKVWWICSAGKTCIDGKNCHRWQSEISSRSAGKACPYCTSHVICSQGCNSVYYLEPQLRPEWDSEKNGDMKKYSRCSGKKVWWICSEGKSCVDGKNCHRWQATVNRRSSGRNCPFCASTELCKNGCNSLFYKCMPEIRDEWLEEKNGSMKNYFLSSGKKVWWKCKKGHIWDAVIKSRTSPYHSGCPRCRNSKLQIEAEKSLKNLDIDFHREKRFQTCKNIFSLPYDIFIPSENISKNIRIELQGEQHFRISHRNKGDLDHFIHRANLDNIKNFSAFVDRHSFLSISYLCKGDIHEIFLDYFDKLKYCDILFRYHITKELYLEYVEMGELALSIIAVNDQDLQPPDVLEIYQFFYFQLNAISERKNKKIHALYTCEKCGKNFIRKQYLFHLKNHHV